jgi:hypothetical protein
MSEHTDIDHIRLPAAGAHSDAAAMPDASAASGMAGRTPARTRLRTVALPLALALGVLADLLVRVPGRPGLNVALWALLGVAALAFLSHGRDEPIAGESWWLLLGALAFAIGLTIRDAEALAVLSLLAAVALLALAAARGATAWLTRAGIGDVVFAFARVGSLCLAGPLGWGRGAPSTEGREPGGWRRRSVTLLRGVAMALPVLLVLGALLMSADPVFERIVRDWLRVDIERVMEHLLFIAFITWFTAGFLRAIMLREDIPTVVRLSRPALAPAEIAVALWVVNLLFLAFMAVQLRYLFGGSDLVQVTPGLSYADYARRGFFEMVFATVLVIPVLLSADWAAARDESRALSIMRSSMTVLVALLLGVLASAAFRMRLYGEAYGLTEQRLYASVFMVWLAIVLLWLVLTVVRGRRERFVAGGVVAAAACMGVLYVMSPDTVIARVNMDRAAAGAEYDGHYLTALSADAVPVLISRMDQLPRAERCRVAERLRHRWAGEREGGWRTWNLSDARARRMVRGIGAVEGCGS